MINLKNDCDKCVHAEVCKKKDTPDYVREKIEDMVSKRIVLDEFDMVNIDISCPNFESKGIYTCKVCNGTGIIQLGPNIRGFGKCWVCNGGKKI